MRIIVPKVITEEEAIHISSSNIHRGSNNVGDFPSVKKVMGIIDELVAPISWKAPTYITVEKNGKHDWHVDTGGEYGSKGFMDWCDYGASIMLNDDEDSGCLEYRDGLQVKNYLDLVIHSSDVEHRVVGNKGKRVTLLLFVGNA